MVDGRKIPLTSPEKSPPSQGSGASQAVCDCCGALTEAEHWAALDAELGAMIEFVMMGEGGVDAN